MSSQTTRSVNCSQLDGKPILTAPYIFYFYFFFFNLLCKDEVDERPCSHEEEEEELFDHLEEGSDAAQLASADYLPLI